MPRSRFSIARTTSKSKRRAHRNSFLTTSKSQTCLGKFRRHSSGLCCTASRPIRKNTASMTGRSVVAMRGVSRATTQRSRAGACLYLVTWPVFRSKSRATGSPSTSGRRERSPSERMRTTYSANSAPNWASLRVSAEILVASGQTVDGAKAIVTRLSMLHALRSILKAHSSVEDQDKKERQARSMHGSLKGPLQGSRRPMRQELRHDPARPWGPAI